MTLTAALRRVRSSQRMVPKWKTFVFSLWHFTSARRRIDPHNFGT
eukprot:COSAG06_NODE_683_length_13114_cov_7.121322_6_plen_45_part_00